MPFIDVRSVPQIAAIQSAFSAILDKANLSLQNIEQQIVQKVAQFYATPAVLDQFSTRIAFVREKAQAKKNNDALGRLTQLDMKNSELASQYANAKPTVSASVAQLQGVQGTGSFTSKIVGSAANAGLLMASVFSATKTQDAAITAVEKGVLTPAEAAELYKRLQNPTDMKKVALVIGAAIFIVLVLRRR